MGQKRPGAMTLVRLTLVRLTLVRPTLVRLTVVRKDSSQTDGSQNTTVVRQTLVRHDSSQKATVVRMPFWRSKHNIFQGFSTDCDHLNIFGTNSAIYIGVCHWNISKLVKIFFAKLLEYPFLIQIGIF